MVKHDDNYGILNIDGTVYKTKISRKFRNRLPYRDPDPKSILSFIPGTVLDILVKPGQDIKTGDDLIIVEAMKMRNFLKSSLDGRIKNIAVNKGSKVAKGTLLIELE